MRIIMTILGVLVVVMTVLAVVWALSDKPDISPPVTTGATGNSGTSTSGPVHKESDATIRQWIRDIAIKKYTDPKKQKHDRGVLLVKLENRREKSIRVIKKMLAGYEEDMVKFYCLVVLKRIARRYKDMERIYPMFVEVLENPRLTSMVRVAAARQVADSKIAGAYEVLINVWKIEPDKTSELGLVLLKQIARLKDPAGSEFLKDVYETSDAPVVKAHALSALGDMKDEKVFELAVEAVKSEELKLRMAASGVLTVFGSRGLEPLKAAASSEPNPALKKKMEDFISRLERQ